MLINMFLYFNTCYQFVMRPPCESIVKNVLPRLRAHVVKILVEREGYNISEVSRMISISSVSALKYKKLLSKRSVLDDSLRDIAEKCIHVLRDKGTFEETLKVICDFCRKLRLSGELCPLHRSEFIGFEDCKLCLRQDYWTQIKVSEREEVLRNLSQAFNMLALTPSFIPLIPEVRTNIAMAVKEAETIYDVAAFPGRLTVVSNRLVAVSEPTFGGSKFLANLLLKALKIDKTKRGILCIKYNKEIDRALKEVELSIAYVRQGGNNLEKLSSAFESKNRVPDALVDLGGRGIEPVTYIFAKDAVEAARTALRIAYSISR